MICCTATPVQAARVVRFSTRYTILCTRHLSDGAGKSDKPIQTRRPASSAPQFRSLMPRRSSPTGHADVPKTRLQRAAQLSDQIQALGRTSTGPKSDGTRVASASRPTGANFDRNRSPNTRPPYASGPRSSGVSRGRGPRDNNRSRQDRNSTRSEAMSKRNNIEEEKGFEDERDVHTLDWLQTLERLDREDVTPIPFDPVSHSREDYLTTGQGTATMAGGNYDGLIEDAVTRLAEPTQDDFRWAPDLARRMMRRGIVRFENDEERDAVVNATTAYEDKRLALVHESDNGRELPRRQTAFAPLGPKQRKSLVDQLVRGSHANPETSSKNRVLGQIAMGTAINGSYDVNSAGAFADTIKSLLPRRA